MQGRVIISNDKIPPAQIGAILIVEASIRKPSIPGRLPEGTYYGKRGQRGRASWVKSEDKEAKLIWNRVNEIGEDVTQANKVVRGLNQKIIALKEALARLTSEVLILKDRKNPPIPTPTPCKKKKEKKMKKKR